MVLDSGASTSILSRRIVEKYNILKMSKPEEWKISLADGSKQVARYTQPLNIEVAGLFCELKFINLDHERVDVLLGLEWMEHFDVKFRPNQYFQFIFR